MIGGLSAEQNLKAVKMASVKYLDNLPTSGNAHGQAFRDLEWEARVQKIAQEMGIGAQFGGKYFVRTTTKDMPLFPPLPLLYFPSFPPCFISVWRRPCVTEARGKTPR